MTSLFNRLDRKASLMGEMIRRTGVDIASAPEFAGDNQIRNAVWRCLSCRHGDACETWLKSASDGSAPPSFCQNAAVLRDARG